MSGRRWSYKVVQVKPKLFGARTADVEAALTQHGQAGSSSTPSRSASTAGSTSRRKSDMRTSTKSFAAVAIVLLIAATAATGARAAPPPTDVALQLLDRLDAGSYESA